ncbi:MAG: hypothetical protein J6A16_07340 [Oscillospiraceae bacterium]|nr:hypothetical protein [Oscillospiraceae bacterium]
MTDKEYEQLISTASRKMGASPDTLKKNLEKGDISALSKGLSKNDKAKLKAVLANKELMARLKSAS